MEPNLVGKIEISLDRLRKVYPEIILNSIVLDSHIEKLYGTKLRRRYSTYPEF